MLAIVGKDAKAALLALYNYWGSRREQSNVRIEPVIVHVGMVEDVESFGPELEFQLFRDRKGLAHGHIEVPGARSIERIPGCHVRGIRPEIGYSKQSCEGGGRRERKEIEGVGDDAGGGARVNTCSCVKAGNRSTRDIS